jgi:hypothetical protein
MADKGGDPFSLLDRHWRWWTTFFWLGISIWFVMENWARIKGFSLGDTDDNMRMMQVRALLDGQGWYDLQQHRMAGSNIHWSRLVDLPIAGLRLLFTPFVGRETAETIAAAAAPLLPMLVAMLAIALIARRMISPYAYLLALVFLSCGGSVTGMWQPLRLDHHGWQLAFLAWTAAALTDPRPLRAGITLGAATALSLVIGLEMILYLAAAGAIAVVMWIRDGEPRRLFAYGVTLAGGCALGFLVFTSEANRLPMCDALSPVWLSAMVVAGALAVLLAWASPKSWQGRLGAAALAGVVIAGAFALTWPHCLGRLEQSSPDLERLWLSKVREAMPVWRHGASHVVLVLTLPVAGLIGGIAMLHVTGRERDREAFIRWAAIALLAAMAAALLAWQSRASPAAQLLAVPGATAFAWIVLSLVMTLKHMLLRVGGIALIALVAVGFARGWFTAGLAAPPNPGRRAVDNASYYCQSRWGMDMINAQPRGMVLTHVDLGPRLITMTHHDAVTGPYHRNARQIVDVMLAFRGSADNARATAARYHADYVLVCPNMAETTIYSSEAPKGFYVQLMRNRVPAWLTPVTLPRGAPYRMWRVVPTPPAQAAPPAQTPAPR